MNVKYFRVKVQLHDPPLPSVGHGSSWNMANRCHAVKILGLDLLQRYFFPIMGLPITAKGFAVTLSVNTTTPINSSQSIMNVILYHSSLCPRCAVARRHLYEIARQKGNMTIVEIAIMRHPLSSWQRGIRMVPAIQIDTKTLQGLLLTKKQILQFIEHNSAANAL